VRRPVNRAGSKQRERCAAESDFEPRRHNSVTR
jgi:hypothetical protein